MKNKSVLQRILTGVFAVLVLAASNSIVRAQGYPPTTSWIHTGSGDWFAPGNWNPLEPSALVDAFINNWGEADILGGDAIAKSLTLGDNQGDSGVVRVDHDHLTSLDLGTSSCRGNIYIGNRGSGVLTIRNQGYANCRYAYVAAVANPTKPTSYGNVKLEAGTIWSMYDNADAHFECTGAGLFIGCTADSNGVGGTGVVNVADGAAIHVFSHADAPSIIVGLSGTLWATGDFAVIMGQDTFMSKRMKVYGTLAPVGTLGIVGDLDLNPDLNNTANTVFHVTPQPWSWDFIHVSNIYGGGNAYLGGRVTVIMTGTFTPPQSFILLRSDNSLHETQFRFESIMPPIGGPCISPSIRYDPNDVYLEIRSCE